MRQDRSVFAPAWAQDNKGNLQRGIGLGGASVAIGILTTFSGVAIELASSFVTDLRHGICVAREPGDTRPVWEATFAGGWRPYDRTRCCGGSASVDHATEECRATSIIQRSTRKRLALPLRHVTTFGGELRSELGSQMMALSETMARGRKGRGRANSTAAERGLSTGRSVGDDSVRVRDHMSHVFGPDPWEDNRVVSSWISQKSLLAEDIESAVNDGIAQTVTMSAGGEQPVYQWVPWERVIMTRSGLSAPFLIYLMGTTLLAMLAALVTRCAPAARGSGIPEVKATVAGFMIPTSFQVQTLMVKVVALALCVGAGLAVGKEGPMIHIGACWSVILAMALSRWGSHDIKETELICVGAAAGVSAAFGAPLGGVLFAVEELGTSLPTGLHYSTMICTLVAAVVAALVLKWLDLTHSHRLTLFEVEYKQAWAPWEAVPFCFLGILGGLMGGAFVLANEAVSRRRIQAEAAGRSMWFLPAAMDRTVVGLFGRLGIDSRVIEIMCLAVFTALSNYPHMLTRMLQNDAIKALFSQCGSSTGHLHDPVGLCSVEDGPALSNFLHLLLGASLLRFVQTVVTFGALSPAGLFVPSLYMGGCLGRALGGLLRFAGLSGAGGLVEPGIYAMVGAGAVLAGVSRLTISLAVVLFELTGGLTYVVPFLLAVLTAKWTGDMVTNNRSVYDVHAELKGFTKVEQPEDVRILNATLEDLQQAATDATSNPAALWTDSKGRVRASDLIAHCQAASPGFVALKPTGRVAVEILGWAPASAASTAVAAHTPDNPQDDACVTTEDCWLQLSRSPQNMSQSVPQADVAVDLSHIVELGSVVRVRHDCPLQTAYCVFRHCPNVRALVSIDPSMRTCVTFTREFFLTQLVQKYLIPHAANAAMLSIVKQAGKLPAIDLPHGRVQAQSSSPRFEVDGAPLANHCMVDV
mmetsp:Transcript_53435/g.153308  ORF Transcript_53435/g.153308 Transcript_53435/m.153308 type:complete len:925 (-) Transcript_53435:89-2863(-)